MITKRSNHIPMFTTIERQKVATTEVRIFLNQNSCGDSTLQLIMIQYDQAKGPVARLRNAYCSHSTPEYQATKSSVRYATPTMDPVTMITMFMYSMCLMVR